MVALQRNQLSLYHPYTKQAEFHAAGKDHRERALLAGNQLGKTWCAGMELSYHTTGRYPNDWPGRRFEAPTQWWASNTNNETVRDNPQRILMGKGKNNFGTGTVPAECIVEHTMARGFPNLVDTVQIRHVTGGISHLQLKAYEQGREAWAGATLTGGIWFDEEPRDPEIYSEGITRLAPGAMSFLTATPLFGMSKVVSHFYPHPDSIDRHLTMMEIEDAEHYTPAERSQRIAGYEEWEREARSRGIPLLGEGAIFQFPESKIEEDPLESIPDYWPQLIGIDFGYDHPFAAVHGAWDRDNDVVHITKAYRESKALAPIHVAALKPWGDWLRCAWPHDGTHTQSDGVTLADQYRRLGLKMLPEHATFHDGGFYVEPGIQDMRLRMGTQKLRVNRFLKEWFAEFRSYHRKNGKIVKENDDLLDATRALLMSLRYARVHSAPRQPTTVGMDWNPTEDHRYGVGH